MTDPGLGVWLGTHLNRLNARGVAAVEFAIVAPVLIVLALGMADFGEMIWQQTEVDNAAAAGAYYAAKHGWDQNGITSAAQDATPLSVTASENEFTGCPGTSGVAETTDSTCTDAEGNTTPVRTYVKVTATTTYNMILPLPKYPSWQSWFPNSYTLTGVAVARIRS